MKDMNDKKTDREFLQFRERTKEVRKQESDPRTLEIIKRDEKKF
jgi:hypothetical protein